MNTTFDAWLRECEAAGQGGPDFVWRGLRGTAASWALVLDGNWTGATMRGILRLSPDAAGDPLVSFTVSSPTVTTVEGETTTRFAFSLTGSQINGLPADTDGDGVARFALLTWLTPSGGTESFFMGGVFTALGD